MAGNQVLSSQSLADESIVHEDCLYPVSELAHWPQVMTSATELLFLAFVLLSSLQCLLKLDILFDHCASLSGAELGL